MRSEGRARHPAGERPSRGHHRNGNPEARNREESASTADVPSDAAGEEATETEALKRLLKQFAELREHAWFYAVAQYDSARAVVRNAMVRLVLAALWFVVVAGLIVMASGFVLSGIAQGLGTMFGEQFWIGTLLTGLVALVCLAVGVRWALSVHRNDARRRTVEKYEKRQALQRSRFGRDAQGRTPASVADND
jgi:hypothetical protein